jgi:alpha-glucosidase
VSDTEVSGTDVSDTDVTDTDVTDTSPGDGAAVTNHSGPGWWRSAVFYQIYPRSFADSNGDGIGDLAGARSRLGYLSLLGVDAIWISPFYSSPMADHGYDVSDPRDVDPQFGTLDDFDALVADAHALGIKVTVDVVPNHFSDQHPWFQAALKAGRGSSERARFVFREGGGINGELPPNNWPSVFGGPAWHRVEDGQWFLHLFAPEQPDLNWDNPEVVEEFRSIFTFWLDRGVDGFRIDVAHGMAKPDGLPNLDLSDWSGGILLGGIDNDVRWDHESVHEHHRELRAVLDAFSKATPAAERMAVGEIWVPDPARLALYVRPDELHLAFNFALIEAPWDADAFRNAIDSSLSAMAEVAAPCTWVLSNHDVQRHVTRYGGAGVGWMRGRAAALLQLSLPGAVYLYNGDELGLENVDLPDSALQDPTWERSGHTERGRDGERVPIPWDGDKPPYGFSTSENTWLPMPDGWDHVTVAAQLLNSGSTLSLYRRALELRRKLPALHTSEFAWHGAPQGALAFRRGTDVVVAINMGAEAIAMPPGEVLLASGPLHPGWLPAHTTVWLRV